MTSLTTGSRLGQYEILAPIGEGGMGEVYRARDTKLGRDVALKVLSAAVADDPERLARFRREAHVLAALNHPHIAQIYGFEDASARHALIMELVDGPTLADRISHGPLPIAEVLAIAKQIAEALEVAHEQGIAHRDLKPANIKVKDDGTVKVLDFGLAKAFESVGSGVTQDQAHSPTITTPAMTMRGVILGTAAYMAPEQAKGKAVDKRSDIWSFGVVLYEMLTGHRGFHADDVSDTLAMVLTRDVDWSALPPDTPPRLRALLADCLVRDPRQRLRDIGDARIAIAKIEGAPAEQPVAPSSATAGPRRGAALAWTVAAVLGVMLGIVLVRWAPWRLPRAVAPTRLNAELGVDASLVLNQGNTALLSPDGTLLAFTAQKQQQSQIYARRLDQLRGTALSGTEGARGMFFSPDSHWIGFFAGGKLKKVAVTGGAPVTLCDAPDDRGGSWGDDDTIVFIPAVAMGTSVMRVSASGGTPQPAVAVDQREVVRFPRFLPGSKALTYTVGRTISGHEEGTVVVHPFGGARKTVIEGGYDARYIASGHLMYAHEGTLFAVPFNFETLQARGSAVPVLENVVANPIVGSALFSVSDATGTLVYVEGRSMGAEAPIQWISRTAITPLRTVSAGWSNPSFSPDGQRLAMDIHDGRQIDVWVHDVTRDGMSRVTFDAADDLHPAWTPDGRRLTYASSRGGGVANLFWQRADGTGDAERLTTSKNAQLPGSWRPDGRVFAFTEQRTNLDIMILPMGGDDTTGWRPGEPTVFVEGPFNKIEPAFSPDGRWLAYASNESGRYEVYVRTFPGPGGRWLISNGGGTQPVWSTKTQELFYMTPVRPQIYVTWYTTEGESFRAEKPRLWSETPITLRPRQRSFALHPDGERIAAMASPGAQAGAANDHIRFIFNFGDELRRQAPAKK